MNSDKKRKRDRHRHRRRDRDRHEDNHALPPGHRPNNRRSRARTSRDRRSPSRSDRYRRRSSSRSESYKRRRRDRSSSRHRRRDRDRDRRREEDNDGESAAFVSDSDDDRKRDHNDDKRKSKQREKWLGSWTDGGLKCGGDKYYSPYSSSSIDSYKSRRRRKSRSRGGRRKKNRRSRSPSSDDSYRRRDDDRKRKRGGKRRKRRSSGNRSDSSRDDTVGHFKGGPGTKIGNSYRIVRDVGLGTFGRVVECSRGDNSRVAIKIVRNVRRYYDSAMIEADICERVNREQRRQNKDLCATMLDRFDLPSGHYCLVFERLGRSLYDFLKMNDYRPFPMFCVRDFSRQLLQALDFLHGFGLIHTDLKPEVSVVVYC